MKVSELMGSDLDKWVSNAEILRGHITLDREQHPTPLLSGGHYFGSRKTGVTELGLQHGKPEYVRGCSCGEFTPSNDWKFGGPILEREKISTEFTSAEIWHASIEWLDEPSYVETASTLLVAAMRCYVASVYGDDVPD